MRREHDDNNTSYAGRAGKRIQNCLSERIVFVLLCIVWMISISACHNKPATDEPKGIMELKYESSLSLTYAKQFQIDYYQGGYKLITIADKDKYLVVPEGQPVPSDTRGMTVLKQPLTNIYMVSSSAMDLVRGTGALNMVKMTGTKEKDWYIDEVLKAMQEGKILYAGKYSAPDYEMLLAGECDLAIENTMIYHKPEVKEKLTELGIPVLVEYSSMEPHPLGRVEWIRLYGELLGKEEEAEKYFMEETERLSLLVQNELTTGEEGTAKKEGGAGKKKVAYFYVTTNGAVNVRKSGDYISKMIELAGGEYAFKDLTDENALSTMNIQMEQFIDSVKDVEYLVYNSTIDTQLKSLSELLKKCPELEEVKAVREKQVWCTEKNMFQETTGIVEMILEFHYMMTGEPWDFKYMYRLNDN